MTPSIIYSEFLQISLSRLIEEGCSAVHSLVTVLAWHFDAECGVSDIEISSAKNMLQRN